MNRLDVTVREFSHDHVSEMTDLVSSVFDEFVGVDYSDRGVSTFRDYIDPTAVLTRLSEGNLIFIAVVRSRIVGVIEIRSFDHICLLFVDKEYHRLGIARKLLDHSIRECKKRDRNFSSYSVNASPYSEEIYVKLGFSRTGGMTETDGIKYIPMKREFR